MANKRFWLGMLVLVLVFGMTVGCDDDNDEKTIVGNWTKTDGVYTGNLKINSNYTWSLTTNSVPFNTNGTWDVNGMAFIYDYDPQNPVNKTVKYSLSQDKNQLILSGEDAELIGGSSPWTRVE